MLDPETVLTKQIKSLLNPASIAIVGASQNLDSISGRPIRYLHEHGYKGKIYPINPKYDEIAGETCYASIKDVPGEIDVAMIAINYKMVLSVLEACAQKEVKHAILFTSGFAETGEEGRKLQDQVAELAKKYNMRILGPNCQGLINLASGNTSSFSASLEIKPFKEGSVGFVTQSGALGYSIFNLAQEEGVGFTNIVSTGNEVDLNSLDFIEYFIEDEKTKVILAYIEEVKDGRRFRKLADRALQKGKPIICLKVGASEIGQKAAASHTASMVSSDTSYEALFRQKGIIRVNDVKEIIQVARVMERLTAMPNGMNLGVITTSGGAGILLADEASRIGLVLPEMDPQAQDQLSEVIPAYGSTVNPVDITAQVINEAGGFKKVLKVLIDNPNVDAIIVVISMIYGESGKIIAEEVVEAHKSAQKPIVVTWPAGDRLMSDNFKVLEAGNVPWCKSPVEGINALGKVMKYRAFYNKYGIEMANSIAQDTIQGHDKIDRLFATAKTASGEEEKTISEYYSKQILAQYGIPVNRCELAASSGQAVQLADDMGYPVVLKVDAAAISHKSDVGGIQLNLGSRSEVEKAYDTIMNNLRERSLDENINGIMVQEMIQGGTETIVGISYEPKFGPMIMFGLGGVYVEVLKDVVFRFAPLSHQEAQDMIQEIKSYKILQGVRGEKPRDVDALVNALVKISHMAYEWESVVDQVDINPLVVLPDQQGVKVLDALIIKR